jgi:D-alanyl-lipoteichoic acid acyltransferase DltB (MBOAT superfamily)
MLLGGLWHGASWNFVLWGFMHGILLLCHRILISTSSIKKAFEIAPRMSIFIGWVVTQYFVFMTWLVFRVEDTETMLRSLKTIVGFDAYWNIPEFFESLPDVKLMTMGLVIFFVIAHAVSGRLGGFKNWLAKQNTYVWGIICGVIISMTFLLRPSETVEFIYFRF